MKYAVWLLLLLHGVVHAQSTVTIQPYGIYDCILGVPCFGISSSVAHPQSVADYQAFMSRTTGDRQAYIEQIQDGNRITVSQRGGIHHQIKWYGNGNNNTVNLSQTSDPISTNILNAQLNNSSNNTINILQEAWGYQQSNTNAVYLRVRQDGNTVNITQQGTRGSLMNLELEGGNKNAYTNQNGMGTPHSATVVITGGPGFVNVTQSGTTHKNINLLIRCMSQPCGVSATQTSP